MGVEAPPLHSTTLPAPPHTTLLPSHPQESGLSDGLAVGRESDVDGLTDPERQTEDEEDTEAGRRRTRTRRRKEKHRSRIGEDQLDPDSQVRGKLPALDTSKVRTPPRDGGVCVWILISINLVAPFESTALPHPPRYAKIICLRVCLCVCVV